MTFSEITNKYILKLEELFHEDKNTGEFTPELSYKPLLNEFFIAVKEFINPTTVGLIFEPKKQHQYGRPDWRFHDKKTLGIYGYVEGKGLSTDREISVSNHSEQIKLYLELGHNLIFTDGIDFVFFYPKVGIQRKISLIKKPFSNFIIDHSSILLLEAELKKYFQDLSARQINEEQLISESAVRAKSLATNIRQLADIPKGSGFSEEENKTIEILKDLKMVVQEHHDPSLADNISFSNFVSQVLIFGLIYAHRMIACEHIEPNERYKKIKKFWSDAVNDVLSDKLRPFKMLVKDLEGELESFGPLGTWYDDCCLLLAHTNVISGKKPDFHILFEKFLAVFDPQTRFDFGAFYTPQELSKFSLELTEKIADQSFGKNSLYEKGNKLIDPCCGTGSFLENLVIKSTETGNNPEIIGFEIMPAPYALSHIRLSMLGDQSLDNVKVLLTNTLSDELENASNKVHVGKSNPLVLEQELACKYAKTPITLIIGNPPSSDSMKNSTGERFSTIQKLLDDFKPPISARRSRQNTQQQLQNEFVKFLRWSTNKAVLSERGIISLIIPSSFLTSPTYRYAREWLMNNFSKLFIVELDQDARTGVRASNIFNTLQGRALIVGIIDCNKSSCSSEYHYYSVANLTRQEKIKFFKKGLLVDQFSKETISLSNFAFSPYVEFDQNLYKKFWPIFEKESGQAYIFSRHCSGIKLAPSSLFVHASRPHLIRRSMEIADSTIEPTVILSSWYSGQDRPPNTNKFTVGVRSAFQKAMRDSSKVTEYCYRPFLTVPALISEEILKELSNTGGGGTRYRPEVLSAFNSKETIGIAIAPSTRDISGELHRFASFCWGLPDNDLCKRGNAHVFCNQFPEYKSAGNSQWDDAPKNNISKTLVNSIGFEVDTKEIVFYTYAILSSTEFLKRFSGALYSGSDESPRIPIVSDKTTFSKIVEHGKQLAELEKPSRISIKKYSGFINQFTTEFNLTDYSLDEQSGSIILKENNRIMLSLGPVPKEILGYQLSGYEIIKQWLKMHSYRYSRTVFSMDTYLDLINLLEKIDLQTNIIRGLDSDIALLINKKTLIDPQVVNSSNKS